MKFEVYCDEVLPDLFSSANPPAQHLLIGGLWLPAELRDDIKNKIKAMRAKHEVWGEIKWRKISASKQPFYEELIDLFMSYGMDLRFRCIAIDRAEVNFDLHHDNDTELGFYKFYYQLLHHWIYDFNEYRIFCDLKSNRDRSRLHVLQRCLSYANKSAVIADVQSLPSPQVALLQLCDILLGCAQSRINERLTPGTAKESVVKRLEARLNVGSTLAPTPRTEEKFNIFRIRLGGGW